MVYKILRDARSLIKKYWWDGSGPIPHFDKGPWCAILAITKASIDSRDPSSQTYHKVCNLLADAIGLHYRDRNTIQIALMSWNDNSSKEEVLARFDKAIKNEKAPT